jgi:hypothetical protein
MEDLQSTYIWQQGWIKENKLRLKGDDVILWNVYLNRVHNSHVKLSDEEYRTLWLKNQSLIELIFKATKILSNGGIDFGR